MLPIERIRVGAERSLSRELGLGGPRHFERADADAVSFLRSSAVKITRAGAPAAHDLLQLARERLGVEREVELYATTRVGKGIADACAYFTPLCDPMVMAIAPATLERLGDAELLQILGHEIGHALLHHETDHYARAAILYDPGPPQQQRDLARRLLTACEMSADRLGLIASRDLDAAIRLEMASATETSPTHLYASPAEYLAQAREVVEGALERGAWLATDRHPSTALRCYALWLFSESRVVRDVTGEGPGLHGDATLDERTRALVLRTDPARTDTARARAQRARDTRTDRADELASEFRLGVREKPSSDRARDARIDRPDEQASGLRLDVVRERLSSLGERARSAVDRWKSRREPVAHDDEPVPDDPYKEALLERFAELEKRMREKASREE